MTNVHNNKVSYVSNFISQNENYIIIFLINGFLLQQIIHLYPL